MGLLELGDGLQFEFSYNAQPLKEQGALGVIAEKENGFLMVSLTLTCSETFLVKGLRMATIGPQASDFLLRNINNQLLQGTLSESQAQQTVIAFEKLYPQLDMIKKIAPIRAKLGSKSL